MSQKQPLAPIENFFTGKDIVSLSQFDRLSVEKVFDITHEIKTGMAGKAFTTWLNDTLSALLFFEPSSRTFLSFASAVKRQGGQTLEMQNAGEVSSITKGETLEDMARVIENYADCIVMRHPEVGSVEKVARSVQIPVINAGDGSGEHPTQALMDMFTIREKFVHLDGIKGLIAGDLLYGRTVHSLLKGLSLFNDVTVYTLAPKQLRLPEELVKSVQERGLRIIELDGEQHIPSDCRFWYWTRVQKERFDDQQQYEAVKNKFIVTPQLLRDKGNESLILMHPLPRVGEIDPRIDSDPCAVYLTTQIENGMYTRMALLRLILGKV